MSNQAFIDGQNLYASIRFTNLQIDLLKFRRYLKEKYNIDEAYYFIGVRDSSHYDLYNKLKAAGFILVFREHGKRLIGNKKGNVDTDIVFTILTKIIDKDNLDKVLLVSGDGDYYKLVQYLINKNILLKLLVPARETMSSLYYQVEAKYINYLDNSKIAP